ncbi:MAG: flagellar protein FliT [Rhodocyclaceae bacterium]
MSRLSLYETMSDLSGLMVEAARDSNWDRLVALEQDVAHLRDTLEWEKTTQPPLTAEERTRKVDLIHQILANDVEVRSYTEPWMASVRKFLGAGVQERNLRRAYGV